MPVHVLDERSYREHLFISLPLFEPGKSGLRRAIGFHFGHGNSNGTRCFSLGPALLLP